MVNGFYKSPDGAAAPAFELLRSVTAGGRYRCNVWPDGLIKEAGRRVACGDPGLKEIPTGTFLGY